MYRRHFLISGSSGGGKKTRIISLPHALYGDSVQSLLFVNHDYETSSKTIEIKIISSDLHMEIYLRYLKIKYLEVNKREFF